MQCQLCNLGKQAELRSNCLPSNFHRQGSTKRPRITLVIENPTKEDDVFGELLTEQSISASVKITGPRLVWKIIDQLGIPRDEVNVVPLTRCAIKQKDGKIDDTQVKACLPYLWQELRTYKPDIVVCMGLTVTKYLTSVKKLSNGRGHYGTFKLLKGFDPVPEDMQDVVVTSTVAPGAMWAQEAMGQGTGKSQFTEDMSSIWKKINGKLRDDRCDYQWLNTPEEIDAYFNEIENDFALGVSPGVIVDLETNQRLDPYAKGSKIVAIGFCHQPWKARCVMINHKDEQMFSTGGESLFYWFCRRLQQLFDRVPIGGWNLKFDVKWMMKHFGVAARRVFFDGHLAHYLIFNMDGAKHDLKTGAAEILGTPIAEAELYAEMGLLAKVLDKSEVHMGNVKAVTLLTYLGGDVDSTFRIYQRLDPMIDNDHCYMPAAYQKKYPGWNHRPVYTQFMLPSVITFAEIEQNGIPVDMLMLEHLQDTYPAKLEALLAPIFDTEWAKQLLPTIDPKKKPATLITSYSNLSKLLYEVVGFPAAELGFERKSRKAAGGGVVFYYPTGKPQREKLKEWAGKNNKFAEAKFLDDIEAYKKAEKLYTSYVKRMIEYVQGDGLLHTVYNLAGTATGRASTSTPSLHIIPKKSDVKKMFVSRWHNEGGVLLQADYSQLEMRLVAAIADDEVLRSIFESGADTHRQMAAFIFRKPEDQITDDERSKGKTISFGVLYGMQAPAMANRTRLPLEVAEEKIENFFKQFKKVARWMKKQVADSNARAVIDESTGERVYNMRNGKLEHINYQWTAYGYITTIFGRKRILKDLKHWKKGFAMAAERQSFNTPIQGTASDIAFQAVLRIQNRLKAENLKSLLFGWIHDSIEIDVYPGELLKVYRIMKEEMEETPKRLYDWLRVPIKASFEIGHGWGYMTEITNFDEQKRIVEVEGDETNNYAVINALSAGFGVELVSESSKEKKGKVVHKAAMKLQPVCEGRAA